MRYKKKYTDIRYYAAPGTYSTARIEAQTEFLRVTVEADGLFIGRELIEVLPPPSIRRQMSSGKLFATWVERPLSQPASGVLDRLLARKEPSANASRFQVVLWEILEMLEASSGSGLETPRRGELILRYLRDSCDQPINRETVAEVFRISSGYVGRLVRQETGESFQAVLLAFRLERARWLLRHSDLAIGEIALGCGFTSANYFAQAFRRAEGMSPGTWRTI